MKNALMNRITKGLIVTTTAMVIAMTATFASSTVASADVASGLKALENEEFGKAFIAFEKAVTDGDPEGLYHMGAMHQAGLGVPKSAKMALAFYRQAAADGVAEASFAIGLFYQKGEGGLLKNPGQAVDWYEIAAKQGSIGAQYNLAMMNATGEASTIAYGSNPNYIQAYKWFSIVLEQMELKNDKAHIQDRIDDISKHMTPGQIERAKKEITTWKSDVAKEQSKG